MALDAMRLAALVARRTSFVRSLLVTSGAHAGGHAPADSFKPFAVDRTLSTLVHVRYGCAAGFDAVSGHNIRMPAMDPRQWLQRRAAAGMAVGPAAAESSNESSSEDEPAPTSAGPRRRPAASAPSATAAPNTPSLSAQEFRAQYEMRVDDPNAPAPIQQLQGSSLPQELITSFMRAGYTTPTFIQAQAWPIAMVGRDLVAIASTGSGKTTGFLLPALAHVRAARRPARNGPSVLVLAPTRELAQQIRGEAEKLGRSLGLRVACLYGGASRGPQGHELRRAPHLVVATPGRLLDFVRGGEVNMQQVTYLVLDEADRMLDMGFEDQINDLLEHMPGAQHRQQAQHHSAGGGSGGNAEAGGGGGTQALQRQTLFFSATWPSEVKRAARRICTNDPVHVFVGNVQEKLVANRAITQRVQLLHSPADKYGALVAYLQGAGTGARTIVFVATKREAERLAMQLADQQGWRVATIHGDKSQRERDGAIAAFRAGRAPVLVATDVAARGLDIKDVSGVVNYDFPSEAEMYIHRIGRTGRAGASGESLTLLTHQQSAEAAQLLQIFKEAEQQVPEELAALAARSGRMGGRGGGGYGRGRGAPRGRGWGGGGGGGWGGQRERGYGGQYGGGGGGRSEGAGWGGRRDARRGGEGDGGPYSSGGGGSRSAGFFDDDGQEHERRGGWGGDGGSGGSGGGGGGRAKRARYGGSGDDDW